MIHRFKNISYAVITIVTLAPMLNFFYYSSSQNSKTRILELQSRINTLEMSRSIKKPPINVSGMTTTTRKPVFHNNFFTKYKFMLDCKNDYKRIAPSDINKDKKDNFNYKKPASVETHKHRIIRGILVYFPMNNIYNFQSEFRWLYRSWIYMQKFEPTRWRTDLIVFVDKDSRFNKSDFFFHQLNCSFANRRYNPESKPMCTLIEYKDVNERTDVVGGVSPSGPELDKLFEYFLNDVDIYNTKKSDNYKFLNFLKQNLNSYAYLNSILMAFEGYEYFKMAGFDFLMRQA